MIERRLVQWYAADVIVRDVQRGYAFLGELTEEEAQLAADPYGREVKVYRQLVHSLKDNPARNR